jgi:hypothetical protein
MARSKINASIAKRRHPANHLPPGRPQGFPMSPAPKSPPLKAEIAAMEPFAGLGMESVFVVSDQRQAEIACKELMQAEMVGFDTESKPTFQKGEKSEGPHVLQFATVEKAFIFHTHVSESEDAIIELLVSERLTKIGFDLKGDLQQISRRFGVRPAAVVDLGHLQLGHAETQRAAVALRGQRRLRGHPCFPRPQATGRVTAQKPMDSGLLRNL